MENSFLKSSNETMILFTEDDNGEVAAISLFEIVLKPCVFSLFFIVMAIRKFWIFR